MLEPIPGAPAAVADVGDGRALVIADYHAGLEIALRYDGVELRSRSRERREAVLSLLDRTAADRVVFLGDLGNAIGGPTDEECDELRLLLDAVADRAPVTVVKGNHDGAIEAIADGIDGDRVGVTPTDGVRTGSVGFVHGHTWPAPEVLEADVVGVGHEHPMVRLEDEVGGARAERVWLRGALAADPFETNHGRELAIDGELVVFPGFNDLLGGTWTNAEQGFLSPFLPEGFRDGQAYLLDGTRLGPYDRV
jgi:putative SbcD/Mre11-related phosphoesterase